MNTATTPLREHIGNAHFMKQLQREYRFEVQVYKEDENGSRTLLRVENPHS
jgi:hypothetical protein